MKPLTFILATLCAVCASAQQQIPIEVVVKDTVNEQLDLGRTLAQRARTASEPSEKMRLTATAIETFEVIGRRWPDAHGWIVSAAILEADLLQASRAQSQALSVLLRAEPHALPRATNTAALLLRIGRLYAQRHDSDELAKRYLERADTEAERSAPDVRFATDLGLADVYERTGDHIAAAARLRRLAVADHVTDFSRIGFHVRAARNAFGGGDHARARADLASAEALLAHTAANVRSDDDRRQQMEYESAVHSLKRKLDSLAH